jgi:DNA-binding PadR family transcriptional regulator
MLDYTSDDKLREAMAAQAKIDMRAAIQAEWYAIRWGNGASLRVKEAMKKRQAETFQAKVLQQINDTFQTKAQIQARVAEATGVEPKTKRLGDCLLRLFRKGDIERVIVRTGGEASYRLPGGQAEHQHRLSEQSERVMRMLRDNGPTALQDIYAAMDMPRNSLSTRMKTMKERDLVSNILTKGTRGGFIAIYKLTEAGVAYLQAVEP